MPREPVAPLEPGQIVCEVTMTETTVADLGERLPHGEPLTLREIPFAFRPPTMGPKKELGSLAQNKTLKNYPARLVATYLGTALEKLDDQAMRELKPEARGAKVGALTLGDVLYLLMRWQYLTNPKGLILGESRCGTCNYNFDAIKVDLGSLPVTVPTVPEPGKAPTARVGLHRGFMFAGALVKTVEVTAPTWHDVWWEIAAANWSNIDLLAANTIRAAICGVDTSPVPRVTDEAIDGIWPEDKELLDEAIEKVSATPDMEIEVTCPRETCGVANALVIDWMSPDFLTGRARA